MGIYLFDRDYLEKCISDPALVDFGRHVIPKAIGTTQVQAYVFRGYWEDVGTIASYFDAGLQLTRSIPPFDFHDAGGQQRHGQRGRQPHKPLRSHVFPP